MSACAAFPRQGSHSEHVDPSLVFCVFYGAFCTFLLHGAYERGVLYVNSRGICNLLLKGQFWITILFEFLHIFRGGCCAMCVLHVFYRVFLIFARSIMTRSYFVRVFSSRSAGVSMKYPNQAFSSYFIDKTGARTKSDFVRILSRKLRFRMPSLQ